MKSTSTMTSTLAILAALMLFSPIAAQNQPATTPPADAVKEDAPQKLKEAPVEATYLDIHNAARKIQTERIRTRDRLLALSRVVINYGSKVEGSDGEFQKVRYLYRTAMESYYKNRILESYQGLREANAQMDELFKKFSLFYMNQASQMLTDCSEKMVDAELELAKTNSTISVSEEDLKKNHFRLQSAYQQIQLARDMIQDNRHDTAIDHLRLSRYFAINVLKGLEHEEAKKKEIDSKYALEILDSLGGTQETANAGAGGAAKQ